MSDVEMEFSPRSDTGSEKSVENPPTPGAMVDSHERDGENPEHVNNERGESDEGPSGEVTASIQTTDDNKSLDKEEDSEPKEKQLSASPVASPISPVASPISPVASPISPVVPISPISPNHEASDDEGPKDMEIDEDDTNNEETKDNVQEEKREDILKENASSEGLASPPKDDNVEDDNSNEVTKEKTDKVANEVEDRESPGKNDSINKDKEESSSLEGENKISSPKTFDEKEASETVESQNKADIKKDADKTVSSNKNDSGNVEDNDLLNITDISDLSVDLTGDEAAIVEDILQSAGDGELLSSGQKQDPDDKEETSDLPEEKPSKDDDDNEEQPGATGELINDIFGSSDEDDEDFEGFEDDELTGRTKIRKKSKTKQGKKGAIASDDDDDEADKPESQSQTETKTAEEESLTVPPPVDSDSDEDTEGKSQVFISDFDRMMEQKKEENRKTRRRKNVDIINDNDDLVADIIKRMQEAAEEDRLANEARQAATKKLKLLPAVLKHMLKVDLMVIFVDSNVLPVLKEWISPLPDGSLPHIQIRDGILKLLEQLPPVDSGALKISGIGKAVMYLFRHPKESRKNKERAGKIISEWSRPIFGVTANFKSMSREEREDRDYANMSKRRRLSSDAVDGGRTPKRIENAIKSDSKALRPGDKGWCMRARVPAPSNKDYVVRPKSSIEFVDFSKSTKKSLNRFEKQKRKFNETKAGKKQRAVEISLEGRKMAL